MANICDQTLYIICEDGAAAMALVKKMVENFKGVSGIDVLKDMADDADWEEIADKLAAQINREGYSALCLLNPDPDARAESGWVSVASWDENPRIEVSMGLKWGPSHQIGAFCESLEKSKYGFATINGGEYMCAMGDEIAYVEWGDSIDGTWSGGLELEEYRELVKNWEDKQPTNLHEKALKRLIEDVDESSFFWSCWDEDYDEDEDEE